MCMTGQYPCETRMNTCEDMYTKESGWRNFIRYSSVKIVSAAQVRLCFMTVYQHHESMLSF